MSEEEKQVLARLKELDDKHPQNDGFSPDVIGFGLILDPDKYPGYTISTTQFRKWLVSLKRSGLIEEIPHDWGFLHSKWKVSKTNK